MSLITPSWIDSSGYTADYVLASNGAGRTQFVLGSQVPGARNLPITFSIFDNNKPYLEYNQTSWATALTFIFDGTTQFTPNWFKIIGSRSGTSGTVSVRIYDVTNLAEIGIITFSAQEIAIYTQSTLSNMPAAEAIWELQVTKSAANANGIRLHYFAME